jgi:serine protease
VTAGDVMLLEQQAPGPGGAFVPLEVLPAVYDAIRLATQDGIIVVEAAGNGGVDLDALGSPFPAGKPDSGAIVVGAGSGGCRTPKTTGSASPPSAVASTSRAGAAA